MKKTLIISALLAGSLSAYSQGTINFNDNKSDFKIHIYAPDVTTPSVQVYGNTAIDKSPGAGTNASAIYTGQLLGGTTTQSGLYNFSDGADYTVELYAAAGLNQPLSALSPVTQYITTIYSTTTAGAGLFLPVSPAPDPGIPNAGSGGATIALAAWYNQAAANGTFAAGTLGAALADGDPAGMSLPSNISNLGNLGSPASTAPDLTGLQSFSLAIGVPEPSTIALGVIGASAFLFRRRK